MTQNIEKTVSIHAPPTVVWEALTKPDLMKQWMGEPEMALEIETDWRVGGPFLMKGFLHGHFENKGEVLQFEPNKALKYSHLSSISRLPDVPESYSFCEFRLEPDGENTSLTVIVSGFPTETIFKHLQFYWRVAPGLLKKFIESSAGAV
jgi:uncharacterized protein YndB with AHSA1/START domain